ncbi:MAG: hypothetical protein M3O50_08910 [Myxococcota bacterium]|nr:hypothetical protein [Myxococcota bacterium]
MQAVPVWQVPPPFVQQIMPAPQLPTVHGGTRHVLAPPPPPPPPVQVWPAGHSAFAVHTCAEPPPHAVWHVAPPPPAVQHT